MKDRPAFGREMWVSTTRLLHHDYARIHQEEVPEVRYLYSAKESTPFVVIVIAFCPVCDKGI